MLGRKQGQLEYQLKDHQGTECCPLLICIFGYKQNDGKWQGCAGISEVCATVAASVL